MAHEVYGVYYCSQFGSYKIIVFCKTEQLSHRDVIGCVRRPLDGLFRMEWGDHEDH